ncbi:MAG: alpha/beta hydrolase-fold protein [Bacteroidales bacterium]|nr:alpha/beta hydrolase-fold protein [Bacteroidales bacterium]
MEENYYKHHSQVLDRDMEYKVYGTTGRAVVAFPSQNGRFFDYENFGMTEVLRPWIEGGRIRLICPDGIDGETWSSPGDPRQRIELQERWYHYIVDEFLEAVRLSPDETFIVTGCSMGGYHSANFFFRRPDLFDTVIALSGIYHADYFFGSYHDDLTYANSPQDFLEHMPADHPYWDAYRRRQIILCVGQGAWEDDLLESTRQMDRILKSNGVPAWVDYWGYDVAHDWPWWRKQIVYFMGKVVKQ